MKDAWYVVEVYCFLVVMSLLTKAASVLGGDPVGAAIFLGEKGFVIVASWLTFRANRIASRLLALYIAGAAVYTLWVRFKQIFPVDVYQVYGVLVSLYFLIGGVKLWFVKELPTRFTDPPMEGDRPGTPH